VLVAVAGLGFVVRTLVRQWDDTVALLRDAEWGWVAVAATLALLGMTAVGLPWRTVIEQFGEHRARREVLGWYFPGQLGKYVPGGIWPIVGRSELGARGGLSRSVSYTSVALSLACTYLAASLTALVLLGLSWLSGEGTGDGLQVLVLLPIGLVLLHPAVLGRIIAAMERLTNRRFPVVVPDYRSLLGLVSIHVPAWLLIGAATWSVARAFDPSPPLTQVMFAAVLSWVIGFVVIPVPGGIGVREAAFVAAAVSLSSDVAAATALTARACFVVADLVGAGGVVLLANLTGTRRASPERPPPAPPAGS
jgi:uncharacterized membrane protein YbhN (UPF0104 family)